MVEGESLLLILLSRDQHRVVSLVEGCLGGCPVYFGHVARIEGLLHGGKVFLKGLFLVLGGRGQFAQEREIVDVRSRGEGRLPFLPGYVEVNRISLRLGRIDLRPSGKKRRNVI